MPAEGLAPFNYSRFPALLPVPEQITYDHTYALLPSEKNLK
jgi:hypothetical protein